jgi:hypothetical protein
VFSQKLSNSHSNDPVLVIQRAKLTSFGLKVEKFFSDEGRSNIFAEKSHKPQASSRKPQAASRKH